MLLLNETLARATPQPQYIIASQYPTSLEMSLESSRGEIGEGKDVACDDGLICCVHAVSPVLGSGLASSDTLALGQQNPITMRMCLSILGLHFLCVLLSYLF